MGQKISVTGQKKLATLQKEFSEKYRKLGIYFFPRKNLKSLLLARLFRLSIAIKP